MAFYNFILELLRYLFGAAMFMFVIVYGLYPLIRFLRRPANPNRPRKKSGRSTTQEDINTAVEDHPVKTNKSVEILEIAKKDPEKTAQLLRQWLAEKKEGKNDLE